MGNPGNPGNSGNPDEPVPGTSRSEAKRQRREEAKERMEDAVPGESDAYLDIALDEEKKLLEKYKKILGL